MKIQVDINPTRVINRVVNKNVRKFANTEARKLLDPFVPFKDGGLSQNVTVTEDYIHYKTPYARRIYEGDNLNFRKDHHPLATAYWDKVAMVSQKDKLAKSIENYINKGGSL